MTSILVVVDATHLHITTDMQHGAFDCSLQTYINQVGRWVASDSEHPQLEWRFGLIDSNDINAFAAPGGYVLVTQGLYRLLRNESELAGVLAHEVAHIVKKHHLKVMEQSRVSLLFKTDPHPDERLEQLEATGARLEGLSGRTNQLRFVPIRP